MVPVKDLKSILKFMKRITILNKILLPFENELRDRIEIGTLKINNESKNQLEIIKRALKFGYLAWPKKISYHIVEKDVLDVGCGTGLHSIGYYVYGVKSYTGLDPKINYYDDRGKNLRKRKFEKFGWTPNDIMNQFPTVQFIEGIFEDIAPNKKFDIAILHNVTEHLHNLEQVFEGITNRLKEDGKILYNHHNYFCWNGHHQMPKTINDINLNDKKQLEYIDWGHLRFANTYDDKLSMKLNKIKIDQLFELTNKYFDIEMWNEICSKDKEGVNRLTNEILKKYDKYSKRDLTTQHVFCIGRLKNYNIS